MKYRLLHNTAATKQWTKKWSLIAKKKSQWKILEQQNKKKVQFWRTNNLRNAPKTSSLASLVENKTHPFPIARRARDQGLYSCLGRGTSSKNSRQCPSPAINKWKPHVTCYAAGKANGDSTKCFYSGRLEDHVHIAIFTWTRLIIGNWNITSLTTGNEYGLVEEAEPYSLDIVACWHFFE